MLKGVKSTQSKTSAQEVKQHSSQAETPPSLEPEHLKGHILLVEDNPVNQELAQDMLTQVGCRVTAVDNGRQALRIYGEHMFDLVFMDLHMPGLDGFATTAGIRQLEQERGNPRVPIIALTADVLQGTPEKCRAAGMDAYLSKPFNRAELEQILGQCLRQSSPSVTFAPAVDTEPSAILNTKTLDQLRTLQRPGAPSILNRVIQLYLDNAPSLLANIESAIAAGDSQRLAAAAHSLKSSSANLGAKNLAETCSRLEALGRQDRPADTDAPLLALAREYPRVVAALRELLDAG